jgi:hypothetical protein
MQGHPKKTDPASAAFFEIPGMPMAANIMGELP